MSELLKKTWFKIILVYSAATLLSSVLSFLKIFQYENELFVPDLLSKHFVMLIKVYLWTTMGIGIFVVTKKIPFERKNWIPPVIVHAVLSVVFSLAHFYIFYHTTTLFVSYKIIAYDVSYDILVKMNYRYNLVIYWAILGLIFSIDYYIKYRKREIENIKLKLKTSELEAQITKSELDTLKAQLKPHFLFNSLNTIDGLIYENPDLAHQMTIKLSDLLRLTIDRFEKSMVLLKEEIDYIDNYMEIQKFRYKEKLNYIKNVAVNTLNIQIPTMVLQPLVENAVKHGIAPLNRNGIIKISSKLNKNHLIISIEDTGNGIDLENKDTVLKGVGIKNTLSRLKHTYSNEFEFLLNVSDLGGLKIELNLPVHNEEE